MTLAEELLGQFLLDRPALTRRQTEADRVIAASLAGHLVHELAAVGPAGGTSAGDRPWRLDPVPLVIDGDVFDVLAAGVTQRLQAMEQLLADLYGPRRAVADGVVPAQALSSSARYRLASVGAPPPPRWLVSYALDVVALADGSWRVVQDLADAPTGVGYALLDRSVMARVAAELLGPEGSGDLASITGFAAELRRALVTTTRAASPRIVLFSGGVGEAAYVEHSSLARLLGFHLVEAPDLVVRKGRVWLRTIGGLDLVDVVYRRVADDAVDPVEISATGATGVPGLLAAAAERGVVLANAQGAGVLEDPALAGLWPAAVAHLTGESLALRQLESGSDLAQVPAFRDGSVGAASVVVRLHAVAGPDGVSVMAGGNGRVLAPGDDPRRPTARLAKDVWVLDAGRPAPAVVTPLPQVDLVSSVPTRAADALYLTGRAAERAEAIARAARVIASRRQQDPGLVSFDGGRWARRMVDVLRVARGQEPGGSDGRATAALDRELAAATIAVGERLGELVGDAASVGEFLSVTTGRVLGGMARARQELATGHPAIDALDATIADLATFTGLWAESTVHGPAWRFGEIGRRLERSLVVLGLVDACVPDRSIDPADIVDRAALEVLLAANESLVAYRRRHRSDVELDAAAHLLLLDEDNPRSFAASVRRLGEHVEAIDWAAGSDAVESMSSLLDEHEPLRRVGEARAAVLAFGELVAHTWFATPVNPMVAYRRTP